MTTNHVLLTCLPFSKCDNHGANINQVINCIRAQSHRLRAWNHWCRGGKYSQTGCKWLLEVDASHWEKSPITQTSWWELHNHRLLDKKVCCLFYLTSGKTYLWLLSSWGYCYCLNRSDSDSYLQTLSWYSPSCIETVKSTAQTRNGENSTSK